MRNRLVFFGVFVVFLIATGWWLRRRDQPLSVAAAADLRFVLPEVLEAFNAHRPQRRVEAVYGSSGNFFAQIRNGAPFDLFLSADVDYPQQLVDEGLADQDDLFLYAVGHLTVWAPRDSQEDVERQGLEVVLDPAVRKIAIANPRFAPYGRAAEAALKSGKLYDKVRDRLVLGDNIAQTAQMVQSGAADVGVLSRSLALSPPLKDGRRSDVPDGTHPPLEQAGVVLHGAKDRESALALRDFLLSEEGKTILQRYGFSLPER